MSAVAETIPGQRYSAENLRVFVVTMIVATLPFDIFYSTSLIYTLLVLTVIDFRREMLRRVPRQFWIFQALFYLAVAGIFYSLNKGAGKALAERQLTIFLFPLLLPLAVPMTAHTVNRVMKGLSVSCVITVLYLTFHMLYVVRSELGLPLFHAISTGQFFNHAFSKPVGIHAGYLSLYLGFSITWLVQRYRAASLWEKYACAAGIVILVTGMFFLASRNMIIATVVVLLVLLPFFSPRYSLRSAILTVLFVCVCTAVIVKVPYLRERFSKQLVSDIGSVRSVTVISYGSAEPRIERWRAAGTLIGRSPLVGYGTGDEIGMLKTEYIRRGLFISYMEELNAHNQYLSYLIKNGILGFLVFVAAFIYYIRLAVKTRSFIYVSFLVLLLIGFYTENILDANKGIVFFALFNTVLGYHALQVRRSQ
jgi:O-antigen ligase